MAQLTSYVVSVAIASGAALSGAIDLGEGRAVFVQLPAAWTAANLSFQVSADGVTWADLYDRDGQEYVAQAAAGRAILLPITDFVGIRHLKIRSGAAAAPVNQGAARTLTLRVIG